MKIVRAYIHLIFLALLFLCEGVSAQQFRKIRKCVDSIHHQLEGRNYGFQVTVAGGNRTKTFCAGYARPETLTTKKHHYNIGSSTKLITALLVFQEIENGRLRLKDTIGRYFSGNPNVAGNISVHELLTHTSGLGEIGNAENINAALSDSMAPVLFDHLYSKIPPPQNDTRARGVYNYCNTNYILLGYILESVNHQSYFDVVRTRIIDPLKLHNSRSYTSITDEQLAHPVFEGQDLMHFIPYSYYRNLCFSAGAITSNSIDIVSMVRQVFFKEKIIRKSSVLLMCPVPPSRYGRGLQLLAEDEKTYLGHHGDNIGYASRLFFNIKDKTIVSIVFNCSDYDFIDEVCDSVLKYL